MAVAVNATCGWARQMRSWQPQIYLTAAVQLPMEAANSRARARKLISASARRCAALSAAAVLPDVDRNINFFILSTQKQRFIHCTFKGKQTRLDCCKPLVLVILVLLICQNDYHNKGGIWAVIFPNSYKNLEKERTINHFD